MRVGVGDARDSRAAVAVHQLQLVELVAAGDAQEEEAEEDGQVHAHRRGERATRGEREDVAHPGDQEGREDEAVGE